MDEKVDSLEMLATVDRSGSSWALATTKKVAAAVLNHRFEYIKYMSPVERLDVQDLVS